MENRHIQPKMQNERVEKISSCKQEMKIGFYSWLEDGLFIAHVVLMLSYVAEMPMALEKYQIPLFSPSFPYSLLCVYILPCCRAFALKCNQKVLLF